MHQVKDPIKNFGNAKPFYELLRDVNPHLPDPELVTMDTITLTAGPNELAALNLTVFITLPDMDKLVELAQENFPMLTVDELVEEAREFDARERNAR